MITFELLRDSLQRLYGIPELSVQQLVDGRKVHPGIAFRCDARFIAGPARVRRLDQLAESAPQPSARLRIVVQDRSESRHAAGA
ncbi:MAG: hypothetical protein U0263_04395 [Polyangiaceae bacterium]